MAFLIAWVARTAFLLGMLGTGICRAQTFDEYHVKAVFLYTFAKFVEWSPQAFSSPSAAVTICVLGEDPFGDFLNEAVRGKTVGLRLVVARQLSGLPAARECNILFIAASERRRMSALLASVSTTGVLTVGDTLDFASEGGMIGFRTEGDRIRLSVNLSAADKAKLRISSRVLSLATIVK